MFIFGKAEGEVYCITYMEAIINFTFFVLSHDISIFGLSGIVFIPANEMFLIQTYKFQFLSLVKYFSLPQDPVSVGQGEIIFTN